MTFYKEKIVEMFNNYASRMPKADYCFCYKKDDIKNESLENAIKKYAFTCHQEDVIGLIDVTLAQNGSAGVLFTDNYLYFRNFSKRSVKIWYDEIKKIESIEEGIVIHMPDNEQITWEDNDYDLQIIKLFLEEIIILDNIISLPDYYFDKFSLKDVSEGIKGLGISVEKFEVVNKLYDEYKFYSRQGHGFAAERANDLHDRLHGRKPRILGDNNVKNGPDRVVTVNGEDIFIQSKYCSTGQQCINACFEDKGNGVFRYLDANGKPMIIEVPSDKIDKAVETMEKKILNGQVPNVTDPSKAKDIVKAGNFTWKQSVNIAKAGNIDSLIYDAQHGMIISTSVFSISTILTFANSIWNGESFEDALKKATFNGLKVGGTAFITTIFASQLSKAGLNSIMVGSSEALAKLMGSKASATIVNAFRTGVKIHGNVAVKSFAKLLRGNVIVTGVTVIVLSTSDIVDIFRGRISGKQLFKNLLGNVGTIGGGTAGWIGGSALGSLIIPGFGTIAGGIVGAFGGGYIFGKLINAITKKYIEDDGNAMYEIIKEEYTRLAGEYLITKVEGEKIVDVLSLSLNQKVLKNMYASKDRKKFADELLTKIFDKITARRKKIEMPLVESFNDSIVEILENIKGDE